jgi:hypothetical protein
MGLRALLVATCALACLHCSAEPAAVAVADDDVGSPPAPNPPAHRHAAPEIEEPTGALRPAPYEISACNCELEEPVRASDGSRYTVGTFSGTLVLGDFTLSSRGLTDILLMKQDIGGHVVWAISAGSPSDERSPRFRIQEDGTGSVSIVALTNGGVDCGAGPLPQWGDDALFLCHFRQADGVLLDGASFPSGK